MKRAIKLSALLAAAILSSCFAADAHTQPETPAVRVASLKGPTTMGMAKLIKDSEAGKTINTSEFMLAGTADEIVPALAKAEIDIAVIPANLAAILYNNMGGAIKAAAINNLGVLYVIEAGDSIHEINDLKGETVYSTGKGTTPEFALNYILQQNGMDPAVDLNIEYKSESAEVAAALAMGAVKLAVLPQPYVTAVLNQNPGLRAALSLSEEWDKVSDDSAMVTGVVIARAEFMEKRPSAFAAFMEEYAASADYVNANPGLAGEWIAELGIVANARLAATAIPECNIVCITGDDMQKQLSGYLAALYAHNPAAVGGNLPDDAFYFIP
jgi:NitT/TauT family transport system substrate-binding protein